MVVVCVCVGGCVKCGRMCKVWENVSSVLRKMLAICVLELVTEPVESLV